MGYVFICPNCLTTYQCDNMNGEVCPTCGVDTEYSGYTDEQWSKLKVLERTLIKNKVAGINGTAQTQTPNKPRSTTTSSLQPKVVSFPYYGGSFEIHSDHFVKNTTFITLGPTKMVPTNIPFEQVKSITSYKKGTLRMTKASISIDTGAYNNSADRLPNEMQFHSDEEMESAYRMIMDAYNGYMSSRRGGTTVIQSSPADEIKKFKELLDMGIITQEEFAAKKKQLLGL